MEVIQGIDFFILDFIQEFLSSALLDKILITITHLADKGAVCLLIAFALMMKKDSRKTGILILFSIIFSFLICNVFLKNAFARTRPYDINLMVKVLIGRPRDFSFPSGHSSVAFATAFAILSVDKRYGIYSIFIATLIAFSRLYLYLHFPTDVLFGFLSGYLSFRLAKLLLESIRIYNQY